MTYFSGLWGPEEGESRLAEARAVLIPGEDVWYLGPCKNGKPQASEIAVTPLRVVTLFEGQITFEVRYPDLQTVITSERRRAVDLDLRNGTLTTLKNVPVGDLGPILYYAQFAQNTPPAPDLQEAVRAAAAAEVAARREAAAVAAAAQAEADAAAAAANREAEMAAAIAAERSAAARERSWPNTRVRGSLTRKASEAILRQCDGDEQPWLILVSGGFAGVLAAFDDRLVIIKTGAVTGWMAGSLGGERSAVFHYADITGIEYNSQFMTGVLEILTASYHGSANKDYWRGVTRPRNADSNDPFTLSNTLPLNKADYNACLAEINELKARIRASKQIKVEVVAPQAASESDGLAEQLERLARLRDAGALSDVEFAAAKARLLS